MNRQMLWIIIISILLLMPVGILADSITLAWDPPTTYGDGTPLNGPVVYNIHFGTSSGKYPEKIQNVMESTYTLRDLKAGTKYYFAVKARDTSGRESNFSKEISATPRKETESKAPQ